jgi:alanyl-tRNA synthetase
VQDTVRSLEKELSRLKSKLAASQGDDLASQAFDVNGIKVLAATSRAMRSRCARRWTS